MSTVLIKDEDFKSDYLDELISAVVTEDILVAEKIAEKILSIDPDNQEAKLVQMTRAFKNNRLTELNSLRFDSANNKNDLLEFLFYQNNKIKTKSSISNSFLDIVRSSYSNRDVNYSQNYNFLLFYAFACNSSK